MKTLNNYISESIVDLDDNIEKTKKDLDKLAQTKELIEKFEDDMIQFITKDLHYVPSVPSEKGLPIKKKTIIPNFGICNFSSRVDREYDSAKKSDDNKRLVREELKGKYELMWDLTLSPSRIGIKDVVDQGDEFRKKCYDYLDPIINDLEKHVSKFLKKNDKNHLFEINYLDFAIDEFSVELSLISENYNRDILTVQTYVGQKIQDQYFNRVLHICLRSDRLIK
jgi:hypothetical protein